MRDAGRDWGKQDPVADGIGINIVTVMLHYYCILYERIMEKQDGWMGTHDIIFVSRVSEIRYPSFRGSAIRY